MSLNKPTAVFFIGIGGIGMSALARYYLSIGVRVFGYDKTKSDLTENLASEGCKISYVDEWEVMDEPYSPESTLVIYTPAINAENAWLTTFRNKGFKVIKRAEALGEITRASKGLCVAGTHGKSTTSAMLAFLLKESPLGCNAFLGAIASNFNSNFLIDASSSNTVIEADEYDRSFLHLSPFAAIITNIDPDHLDIYGTEEKFKEGFRQFAMKIDPAGFLILKEGLQVNTLCKKYTYSIDSDSADYIGKNIRETEHGAYVDLITPEGEYNDVCIGINGSHNVENAIASLALCHKLGLDLSDLISRFASFSGLKRRFERIYSDEHLVFIDDYAHHPTEINRLIGSIRAMYPEKKVTGVYQPHLFSRTRDFGDAFAEELSKLDHVYLLPVYPARELPIQGIDSLWLLQKIKNNNKQLVSKSELLSALKSTQGVLLTIGAGDIDRLVEPIKQMLSINESSI